MRPPPATLLHHANTSCEATSSRQGGNERGGLMGEDDERGGFEISYCEQEVLLSILIIQTHFPISDATAEIDAMLARNTLIGEDEELMPSEISRRVLMAQKRYIGYETLRRDMVPCQKPGASYYDCRSGQANSYGRGCETITRCARDTSDITT
ncbi:hypothetical protein Bca52824_017634 [Brassica carinata]|uniref:Uncharacterized protein n=1 Tax=Brassica carinata TaxID=52824 RepID=A0A8X8AXK6_BRACI|nr:hypothetical protein Bca52824_017634 [Brassica carinata]